MKGRIFFICTSLLLIFFFSTTIVVYSDHGGDGTTGHPGDDDNITEWVASANVPAHIEFGIALLFSGDDDWTPDTSNRGGEDDDEAETPNLNATNGSSPPPSLFDRGGRGGGSVRQIVSSNEIDTSRNTLQYEIVNAWNRFATDIWNEELIYGRGQDASYIPMHADTEKLSIRGEDVVKGMHITFFDIPSSVIAHTSAHAKWRGNTESEDVGYLNYWYSGADVLEGISGSDGPSIIRTLARDPGALPPIAGKCVIDGVNTCAPSQVNYGYNDGEHVGWSDYTYRIIPPEGKLKLIMDSATVNVPPGHSPNSDCTNPYLRRPNPEDGPCSVGDLYIDFTDVSTTYPNKTHLWTEVSFNITIPDDKISPPEEIDSLRYVLEIRKDGVGIDNQGNYPDNVTIILDGKRYKLISPVLEENEAKDEFYITGIVRHTLGKKRIRDGIRTFNYNLTENISRPGKMNWSARGYHRFTANYSVNISYTGTLYKKYNLSKICDEYPPCDPSDDISDDERVWIEPLGATDEETTIERENSTYLEENFGFYIERRFSNKTPDGVPDLKPDVRIGEYPNGSTEVQVNNIQVDNEEYDKIEPGPDKHKSAREFNEGFYRIWDSITVHSWKYYERKTIKFNMSKNPVSKSITFNISDKVSDPKLKDAKIDVYGRLPYKAASGGVIGSLKLRPGVERNLFIDTLSGEGDTIAFRGCRHRSGFIDEEFNNKSSYQVPICKGFNLSDYPSLRNGNLTFNLRYNGIPEYSNPVKGEIVVVLRAGTDDNTLMKRSGNTNVSDDDFSDSRISHGKDTEADITPEPIVFSQWQYFTARHKAYDSLYKVSVFNEDGIFLNSRNVEGDDSDNLRTTHPFPVYSHVYPADLPDSKNPFNPSGIYIDSSKTDALLNYSNEGSDDDFEQGDRLVYKDEDEIRDIKTEVRPTGDVRLLDENWVGDTSAPPFLMSVPSCFDWNENLEHPRPLSSDVVQEISYNHSITQAMRVGDRAASNVWFGTNDETADIDKNIESDEPDYLDRCNYELPIENKTKRNRESLYIADRINYLVNNNRVKSVFLSSSIQDERISSNKVETVTVRNADLNVKKLSENNEGEVRIKIYLNDSSGEPIDLSSRPPELSDRLYPEPARGVIKVEKGVLTEAARGWSEERRREDCNVEDEDSGEVIHCTQEKYVETGSDGSVTVTIYNYNDKLANTMVQYRPVHWTDVNTNIRKAFDWDKEPVVERRSESSVVGIKMSPIVILGVTLLIPGILFYLIMVSAGKQVDSIFSLYKPVGEFMPGWAWAILALMLLLLILDSLGLPIPII